MPSAASTCRRDVRSRIVEAAEGNPLFVEQLLSMLVEEEVLVQGESGWQLTRDLSDGLALPGSIEALLTARLDALSDTGLAVIEPASVIGLTFVRPALEELVLDGVRPALGEQLADLTQKQLIRPEEREASDVFRFEHIMIRDAAYNRLLKRARADLHERFANWAEKVNRERHREAEYEEILAYHLEQAYRYLGQLGPLDDHGQEVGVRAAAKLAATGRRAFERGDMAAAANLLERATALLPPLDPGRLALFPELGEALLQIGEFAHAESLLEDAVASAELAGEPTLAANAEIVRMLVLLLAGGWANWEDQATAAARNAIALCGQAGDDVGLARAWRLLAWIKGKACRLEETALALERAIECARSAGDVRQERRASTQYALTVVYGPTPVEEGLKRCDEISARVRGDRQAEAAMLCVLAQLESMRCAFDRARDLYTRARAMFEELGLHVDASTLCLSSSRVELLAGDPEAAERELRRGYEHLEALGERYLLSSIAGLLAEALVASDRLDEALQATRTTEELADEGDVDAQTLWRSTRAKVLALRGSLTEAEALARDAVAILAPTDDVVSQVAASADLAWILLQAGQEGEAQTLIADARALAERKGSLVMVERLDALLAGVAPAQPALAEADLAVLVGEALGDDAVLARIEARQADVRARPEGRRAAHSDQHAVVIEAGRLVPGRLVRQGDRERERVRGRERRARQQRGRDLEVGDEVRALVAERRPGRLLHRERHAVIAAEERVRQRELSCAAAATGRSRPFPSPSRTSSRVSRRLRRRARSSPTSPVVVCVPLLPDPPTVCASTVTAGVVTTSVPLEGAVKRRSAMKGGEPAVIRLSEQIIRFAFCGSTAHSERSESEKVARSLSTTIDTWFAVESPVLATSRW